MHVHGVTACEGEMHAIRAWSQPYTCLRPRRQRLGGHQHLKHIALRMGGNCSGIAARAVQ